MWHFTAPDSRFTHEGFSRFCSVVERSLLYFTPWLQLEPFWRRLRPAFRLGNLLHCVPTLESASIPFDVFCFLRHDTKWCLWWLKQRWKVLQGQGKESFVDYCTSPVPGGKGSVGGGREGSPFHSNWSYCSKALSEALNTNIAFTAGCSTRGSSSLLMLPGDKTNESIPSETNQPTKQPTPKPKPRHSLVVLDIFWPNLLSFQQPRGLIYGVQCHSWHTQSYKYWHTVLFQIDLTTFALLNVGGSWIYGPLWGNFSCYTHKCIWTVLFAYLPLISCHWTTDLWGTWESWDWYSRVPHHWFWIPDLSHEVSYWVFGGVWLQKAGLRASLHATKDALRTERVPKHFRAGCQDKKSRRKRASRISCS